MKNFWSFVVNTNIMFPEEEYYITYKNLEIKYINRCKEKRADNVTISYSNDYFTEQDAYKTIAEYLNSLAFCHEALIEFYPVIRTENDVDLRQVKYMSDEPRKYDCFTCVPSPCLISNIVNEEQAQLISLFNQAKSNQNCYFRLLFYWHCLVFPNKDENLAIDFINNNLNKADDFHINYIKNNPIFSQNGKITSSFGNYVKWGVRHSIAHIIRTENYAIQLKLEDYEQIKHIGTIARILEHIARYKIEEKYNVKRFAPIDILYETYSKI